MLRKIISIIFFSVIGLNAAFAGNMGGNKLNSTGKLNPKTMIIEHVNDAQSGPYLGASVGSRENATGRPTVYGGVEGTIFVGYSLLRNEQFYAAAELFGAGNENIHDSRLTVPGRPGVRTSWSFGADLIPGIIINDDFLLYLRGGFIDSRFTDLGTEKVGWRAGLGVQTPIICEQLNLRLEYIVSGYTSSVAIGKPFGNQANLGLLYQFLDA